MQNSYLHQPASGPRGHGLSPLCHDIPRAIPTSSGRANKRVLPGASLVTALFLAVHPGVADASQTIDALFQQFDQLTAATPSPVTPVTPLRQTEATCELEFSDLQSQINELNRRKGSLEAKATELNDRYKEIISAMPRLGAPEKACTNRMQRNIARFREDVAALQLDELGTRVESMIGCVVNFRQRIADREQLLTTTQSDNQIAEQLKLNKLKKAVTDLDFERNVLAVFLDQVDGLLARRMSELTESEGINCSEGDVF